MPAEIDHRNGVKDDNHIENLRECTHSQNLCNSSGRSGIKNVYWNEEHGKWRVQIAKDKKQYHLGYFEDKELAEFVASEARDVLHGEYAHE